ncbi:hypothetical protein SKAU_G00387520 [Synaphobranchus kaupii]|uniref:Uncharacterized protein n=1 Tax=Synaphobranchus kaupii TaxID=118154 RepID=A0A9Q1EAV9_SYNKA|nr:hypothetical protein SKAU_G00387520 [Synaphobranchus kaupii]
MMWASGLGGANSRQCFGRIQRSKRATYAGIAGGVSAAETSGPKEESGDQEEAQLKVSRGRLRREEVDGSAAGSEAAVAAPPTVEEGGTVETASVQLPAPPLPLEPGEGDAVRGHSRLKKRTKVLHHGDSKREAGGKKVRIPEEGALNWRIGIVCWETGNFAEMDGLMDMLVEHGEQTVVVQPEPEETQASPATDVTVVVEEGGACGQDETMRKGDSELSGSKLGDVVGGSQEHYGPGFTGPKSPEGSLFG